MRGFSRRLLAVGAAVLVGVTAAPTPLRHISRSRTSRSDTSPSGHLRPDFQLSKVQQSGGRAG
jgi:hypothetical protein